MNPWSRARVERLIGEEETHSLEFKSAKPLQSEKEKSKFLDSLSHEVSAFLNSEGGVVVIGIDEDVPTRGKGPRIGRAALISPCPRSMMNGTRLQSAICDRIHPGVSSYVTVHTVKIECEQGTDPNEDQLVFIIEVRAGNTAYQAVDKRYYVRRGTEAFPMEDKDIRLRMLASDYPRVELITSSLVLPRGHSGGWQGYEERWQKAFVDEQKILKGEIERLPELSTEQLLEKLKSNEIRTKNFPPHDVENGTLIISIGVRNIGITTVNSGCMKYNNPAFKSSEVSLTINQKGQHEQKYYAAMIPVVFSTRFDHALFPELEVDLLSIRIDFPKALTLTDFDKLFLLDFYVDGGMPANIEINLQAELASAVLELNERSQQIKNKYEIKS